MNLYQQAEALDKAMASIDQWIAEHQEEIAANGGVIPDEVTKEYDELMKQQKDSIAWSAKKIQEYDLDLMAIDSEQQRLKARREQIARKQAWRERMLFDYLKREGIDELKHPLVTVAVKKNPPRVIAPMWSQLELGQLWASPEYEWCVIRKDPEFKLNLSEIRTTMIHPEQVGPHSIPEGVVLVQDERLAIK